MLNKFAKLLVLLVLAIPTMQVSAQSLKLPYKDVGACPFEGCQYGRWIANKETTIYKEMRDGSPVAFKVKNKEKITSLTGIVMTLKTETARVLKATKIYANVGKYSTTVKSGETLSLIHYQGEGFYLAWYKNRLFSIDTTDNNFKIVKEPETVWWVKIKNSKGKIGWTKLVDNFDGKDKLA